MNLIGLEAVRDGMMKYGFHAPDMTVHEFVEDELPSVQAVPLGKLCEWLAEQDYEIYCFMCQEAFDAGGGCPNQVSDSQWRCGGKEHWKAFLKKVMEGWDGDVH